MALRVECLDLDLDLGLKCLLTTLFNCQFLRIVIIAILIKRCCFYYVQNLFYSSAAELVLLSEPSLKTFPVVCKTICIMFHCVVLALSKSVSK